TVAQLSASFGSDMQGRVATAVATQTAGPLQFLVDMVPENIFGAAADNSNMLQVIFFAIFFGICLLLVDQKSAEPVKGFINGFNEVIMKMVDLIMLVAPIAVFALLASLVTETSNPELFKALAWYMFTVVLGLILVLAFYLILVYLTTGKKPGF